MVVPKGDSHITSPARPINSCISSEESSVIFWTPTIATISCRREFTRAQAVRSPTALDAHAASTLKVGAGLVLDIQQLLLQEIAVCHSVSPNTPERRQYLKYQFQRHQAPLCMLRKLALGARRRSAFQSGNARRR